MSYTLLRPATRALVVVLLSLISSTSLFSQSTGGRLLGRVADPSGAVLAGVNGSTGVGLAEVYDLEPGSSATFSNLSTRGFVGTGDDGAGRNRAHHLADADWRRIVRRGVDPAAHRRLDREELVAHQDLPLAQFGRRAFGDFKVLGLRDSGGAGFQQDLSVLH